ncbi:MAG: alpha-hydroxy-acid oxidizing protein [Agathobacter rectalis]
MAGTPFIVKVDYDRKGALKAKRQAQALIIVSNHGGRADWISAQNSLEVLESIVKALGWPRHCRFLQMVALVKGT